MDELKSTQKSSPFDIKNYLLKLIAHWYLFVISIAAGYIYNYFENRFKIDSFSTFSTVILHDELQNTQAVVGGLQLFDNRKNYENEFGVLKSYELNRIALSELDFTISYFKDLSFRSDVDLYKKTPFIVELDTSKNQTNWLKCYLEFTSENEFILQIKDRKIEKQLAFGEKFESGYLNFTIREREDQDINYKSLVGSKYYFYKNDFNSLVNSYKDRLNVDLRSPNSSILWLWINGTVPERIVDYINKLIEVYLRQSLEAKNRVVINTIKFIDDQLAGVIDSLDDVEDKLQLFKQSNKILDISKEGEMLFEELDKLQQEKKILEIKKNFYDYLTKNLKENGELTTGISPSFLDINDPVLEALLTKYQTLQSEKEILGYDVKKDIPSLDIVNLKLKSLQKELSDHIANSSKAIDYNMKDIEKKMALIDAKLRQIPSVEREIQNIQRRYKLNDNIYTFLLERRTEAGITMASNSPGAKILDVARYENVIKNTPQGGNRTKIIFLSLLIPILIIVIKDFFNNKIIDKSDVEKGTNIPILGSVTTNKQKVEIPTHTYPKSPIAESFRLLKTNLQFLLVDKTNPVISVSSTVSGEGKTFCSTNLASLLAHSKKKTLLIGMDLRKPTAHLPFQHPNVVGLSSYLIGLYKLEDILFETHIRNLTLIPSGPIPPNPAELIESEKMLDLIQILKEKFDYIIVDTPPVAHVTDAMLIARFCDANIFVLRQNYSSKNVLRVVGELHDNKKMSNMGIIINDVNPSIIFGLKYGYGFSYGYNYGYGDEDAKGYFDIPQPKPNALKKAGRWFYGKLKAIFS
jgi:tyrosine-protein kinase Etk/Wzc